MIARNKLWNLAPGSVKKYEKYQDIKLVDSILKQEDRSEWKYEISFTHFHKF